MSIFCLCVHFIYLMKSVLFVASFNENKEGCLMSAFIFFVISWFSFSLFIIIYFFHAWDTKWKVSFIRFLVSLKMKAWLTWVKLICTTELAVLWYSLYKIIVLTNFSLCVDAVPICQCHKKFFSCESSSQALCYALKKLCIVMTKWDVLCSKSLCKLLNIWSMLKKDSAVYYILKHLRIFHFY